MFSVSHFPISWQEACVKRRDNLSSQAPLLSSALQIQLPQLHFSGGTILPNTQTHTSQTNSLRRLAKIVKSAPGTDCVSLKNRVWPGCGSRYGLVPRSVPGTTTKGASPSWSLIKKACQRARCVGWAWWWWLVCCVVVGVPTVTVGVF
jgi:hypothetical protein